MTSWPSLKTENGKPGGSQPPALRAFPAPPPSPPKVSPRLRLDNGPMVRREIVKVYRAMKAGELDITKGTKLVYTLEVLSRMIERQAVEALADRLDAAEAGQ